MPDDLFATEHGFPKDYDTRLRRLAKAAERDRDARSADQAAREERRRSAAKAAIAGFFAKRVCAKCGRACKNFRFVPDEEVICASCVGGQDGNDRRR